MKHKAIEICQKIPPYTPVPTMVRFHSSTAPTRCIRGPRGSGKSVGIVWEIMLRMIAQDCIIGTKVRRTKWVFVGATHERIAVTAVKEWNEWFGGVTKMNWSIPESAEVNFNLPDGTSVEATIDFSMANDVQSAGKFKSDQLTGAWIVEAAEIKGLEIYNMLTASVGRSPKKIDGGCTWSGIIMDTNSMEKTHWWPNQELNVKPDGWEFFNQPPALLDATPFDINAPEYVPNEGQDPRRWNADGTENLEWGPAENICNMPGGWGFYYKIIASYPREWIRVFVQNQYGKLAAARLVYPEYSDSVHAQRGLQLFRGLPIRLGFDWGRTPCCVICQIDPHGQWRCLEEVCGKGISVQNFVKMQLAPILMKRYNGIPIIAAADPAGFDKGQATDGTCADQLTDVGITVVPAPSNKLVPRRESVASMLISPGGFLLDPDKCPTLHDGFKSDYSLDENGVPNKDGASHAHDALQAIALHTRVNPQDSGKKWSPASYFGAGAMRDMGFGNGKRMVWQGGALVPESERSAPSETPWGNGSSSGAESFSTQSEYDPSAHF